MSHWDKNKSLALRKKVLETIGGKDKLIHTSLFVWYGAPMVMFSSQDNPAIIAECLQACESILKKHSEQVGIE